MKWADMSFCLLKVMAVAQYSRIAYIWLSKYRDSVLLQLFGANSHTPNTQKNRGGFKYVQPIL